jgi:thiol-disulfide isomerase/thioredoxin
MAVHGLWSRRDWLGAAAAAGFANGVVAQGSPAATTLHAPTQTASTPGRVQWPSLRLLDGRTLAPEDWAGTPAIVVFWATWCAYCKRHNAHIDHLFQSLGSGGLRVLGVAIDGHVATVERYMQTHGYRFPVVLDEGPLRQRFTTQRVVPMTCLVDRSGQVRQCIPGEMSLSDVMGLPRALAA